MKQLLEYLQPIFEGWTLTFPEKNEAIEEFRKILGDVPEEIMYIVNYLYDNYEKGSFPLVFSNKDNTMKTVKIQPANWTGFVDFIKDNLSDSVTQQKEDSIWIDGIHFLEGKGTPGGKYTSEGDTAGQYAEALVCYFFNHYNTIDYHNTKIKEFIDEIEKKSGAVIDDSWRKSIQLTVNAINTGNTEGIQWNNSNYVAVHTDGKDIELSDAWPKEIAKIYSGKEPAQKVLGVSLSGIPSKLKKDTWNKADIILVKRDRKDIVQEIKNSLMPIGSEDKGDKSDSLNNILNSLVMKGDIVPISLKKLSNENYHIKAENIPSDSGEKDICVKSVYVSLPTKIETPGYAASMFMYTETEEGLTYRIQFRAQTDKTNSLSIEAGLPGNSNARGGKGVTLIKNELGITKANDKSYLCNFKDLKDMCSQLFNTGFVFNGNGKSISNINDLQKYLESISPKSGNPLQERTCFRGFVGIYNKYCDYAKDVKGVSDQLKFATNVLNKCTLGNGKSSFYLIS